MGSPVQKSEEGAAAVGDGGKGADKDGSNSVGTGDDIQGGGSDGAALQERKLGSDGDDADSSVWVPTLGGSEDSRNVVLESWGGGMGVIIGGGGLVRGRDVENEGVHSEVSGYHCGVYCESTNI